MKQGEGEKGEYEKVIQGRRRTNKLVLKIDFIFYTEHAGRNDLEVAVHPGVTLILWVMHRFKKNALLLHQQMSTSLMTKTEVTLHCKIV